MADIAGTVIVTQPNEHKHKLLMRIVQFAITIGVAILIFGLVIPKVANYSAVWKTITSLTWLEFATLFAAMFFNLCTYWPQQTAAMPGLKFWQAAVNNQTTTSVSNTVPGGAAIA